MIIKPRVSVLGIKPETVIALVIAEGIWERNGQELVITSGTDGEHSKNSRHYIGMAVDLRTRYFSQKVKRNVAKTLKHSLSDEYKVVSHLTHIHVQYNGSPG